jgi:phage-related protein (TIGR01555 family)
MSGPSRMARADRWVNFRNGFGTNRDPIARTTFRRDITLSREMLDALFRFDWLSRRAVELPAKDATRKWVRLLHDDAKRVQLAEKEVGRLKLRSVLYELIVLARLYGGAVTVLGAWDGRETTEPLGRVREMWFLNNVDRFLAYPMQFDTDKDSPGYGDVELYQITRPIVVGSDVSTVHESRIVRMDGAYLPPLERIRNFTYGASVLEQMLESFRQHGVVTQAMAGVVQDFVTKKLKIQNFQELLESPDSQAALETRLAELAAGISIFGIAAFGMDEEFEKMGTPISGLPDVMDRFAEIASAACDIPKSVLFSNQTGALGGDAGDNDIRNHYDNVQSFQENEVRPVLQRLLDVCLQPLGFEAGEMGFEFVQLYQLTEMQRAELRQKVATTDGIYIDKGVVEPEEVALSRFAGDGVNTDDMHIETAPRIRFLKEMAKEDTTPTREASEQATDPDADPNAANGADKKPNGKDKDATAH